MPSNFIFIVEPLLRHYVGLSLLYLWVYVILFFFNYSFRSSYIEFIEAFGLQSLYTENVEKVSYDTLKNT